MKKENNVCDKCGKVYNDYPALSRKDNESEICPLCGVEEAMDEWNKYKKEEEGGK